MSETLPKGWAKVVLDDVVEVRDFEREPINSTERNERLAGKSQADLFPYYGATGQVGWIDGFRSDGEQVLLGEDGAPFLDPNRDKAYIVDGRYWVNNHAHVLRGIEGLMDNRVLAFQLNMTDYQHFVTGSTRLKLTSAAMKRIPLLVPPAAEQTRIVETLEALLSDLDAGVAELKAAQRKLARYRQSLLKAAVDGTLTAGWRADKAKPQEPAADLLQRILRERRARWEDKQRAKFAAQGKPPPKGWQAKYPEPAAPDVTGLPALPEGWMWASVEQIASDQPYALAIGPFGSNLIVSDYRGEGVPLVFVRNIRNRLYGGDATKFVSAQKAEELKAHQVSAGDVLVTKMGEPPGDADVYPAGQPDAVITADCIKVRTQAGLMLSEYLAAAINSPMGASQIKPMTQGVAQKKISLGRFSTFAVPLPPLEEQRAILDQLDTALAACDAQQAAIAHGLKQAAAQRRNLLKTAFAGQLVPQDPGDEPASALLARIRASKADNAASSVSRRGRKPKTTA